jgi:hypothetical protein
MPINVLYHRLMHKRPEAKIMSYDLVPAPVPAPVFPVRLFTLAPKAAKRVRDFFTAELHNEHTRKAYLNAALLRCLKCLRRLLSSFIATMQQP